MFALPELFGICLNLSSYVGRVACAHICIGREVEWLPGSSDANGKLLLLAAGMRHNFICTHPKLYSCIPVAGIKLVFCVRKLDFRLIIRDVVLDRKAFCWHILGGFALEYERRNALW